MPSTYAHQHFGNLVFDKLPEKLQEEIAPYRGLYNIGLQGPDIFFYYKPLHKNDVAAYGGRLHGQTGEAFFGKRLSILAGLDPARQPAARAFLCGTACHFTLDTTCHGYVNWYEKTRHVPHNVIEGDFDRELLAAAGYVPVMADISAEFAKGVRSGAEEACSGRGGAAKTAQNCADTAGGAGTARRDAAESAGAETAIAPFYPEMDEQTIRTALHDFVRFHHILLCRSDLKRNFLLAALKVLGQYDALRGHIVGKAEDPSCHASNQELVKLLSGAVSDGVLMVSYIAGQRKTAPALLSGKFDWTADSWPQDGTERNQHVTI